MGRSIYVNDGSNKRFVLEAAKQYDSDYIYVNNYKISKATGRKYAHETLYLTKSGTWIKRYYTDWKGTKDKWKVISEQEAFEWLEKNAPGYLKNIDT